MPLRNDHGHQIAIPQGQRHLILCVYIHERKRLIPIKYLCIIRYRETISIIDSGMVTLPVQELLNLCICLHLRILRDTDQLLCIHIIHDIHDISTGNIVNADIRARRICHAHTAMILQCYICTIQHRYKMHLIIFHVHARYDCRHGSLFMICRDFLRVLIDLDIILLFLPTAHEHERKHQHNDSILYLPLIHKTTLTSVLYKIILQM